MSDFRLVQGQRQQQVISPQMQQSVKMLTMNSMDLRDEILQQIQKNPALEIRDSFRESKKGGEKFRKKKGGYIKNGEFNDALFADSRQTLQSHLLNELRYENLSPDIKDFCERIIQNLDSNGFNLFPPRTLFFPLGEKVPEKLTPKQEFILKKSLKTVRLLNPVGTAFSSPLKSLRFRVNRDSRSPQCAKILLNDDDLWTNKNFSHILHKNFVASLLKSEKYKTFSRAEMEAAIDFIKAKGFSPGGEFSENDNFAIIPEAFVHRVNENGLQIAFENEILPKVELSKEFCHSEGNAESREFVEKFIREGKEFLRILEFRQSSFEKVVCSIVHFQKNFFLSGPAALIPLSLNDVAEKVSLSVSSVSRLSRQKYLECDWGIFEIRYFFSAAATKSSGEEKATSAVQFRVKSIIEEASKVGKKISDSKICEKLKHDFGIDISRRTVAKYRQKLELPSSYEQ